MSQAGPGTDIYLFSDREQKMAPLRERGGGGGAALTDLSDITIYHSEFTPGDKE